jgi:hypothetical protein
MRDDWVTYRMADGSQIDGEFSWTEDLEWWENDTEPTELIKETWRLISSETITVNPDVADVDEEATE